MLTEKLFDCHAMEMFSVCCMLCAMCYVLRVVCVLCVMCGAVREEWEGSSHIIYNPVLPFTHLYLFFGFDQPDSTLVLLPG